MEPDCWLGKIDISAYFFRIPLAYEARAHFRVCAKGSIPAAVSARLQPLIWLALYQPK